MRLLDFADGFESASEPTSVALPALFVSNTPSGNLSSTNQQDVNNELQNDINTRATITDFSNHASNVSNPHSVTKAQVGLSNVDNTSDVDKPVSTAVATAINERVPLSTVLAKGDLLVGASASSILREPVGSDGQILTADSSVPSGVKWTTSSAAPSSSLEFSNGSLTATVSANAMTISLKDSSGSDASPSSPIKIGFRSGTTSSGIYNQRSVTGALSTVISSGSTAGHTSGNLHYIFVYALDNAGTVELAWSSAVCDDALVHSTTAEGGAGGADSKTALYSTTARTNVPIKLIGRLRVLQTIAGTHASAPSEIVVGKDQALMPQNILIRFTTGAGFGSDTLCKVRLYSVLEAGVGQITYLASSSSGTSVTILTPGIYSITVNDSHSSSASWAGVSLNASSTDTALSGLAANQRLISNRAGAALDHSGASRTVRLYGGDILRPHFEDKTNANAAQPYDSYFIVQWIGW